MKIVPIKNVGVYHDSDVNFWHFGRIQDYSGLSFRAPDYFLKSANLQSFLNSIHSVKFANYHVAFPANNGWLDRFHLTYPYVNHSIIVCSELHQETIEQLYTLDLPNVSIFVCGYISKSFVHAKIYQWMDWFITAGDFYRRCNTTLLSKKITNTDNKEKFFDVLLGCQRYHRDYINEYIDKNLADQVIKTYFRRWNVDLRQTDHIFESTGIEFLEENNYFNTVHIVKYYGHKMNLSAIVPIDIYNRTHYSLVAETNYSNDFNFYTEKIVKPILAKRLFIVVAGKNYLKNLRSLGFRTFSDVIDESYDQVEDNRKRWNQALAEVSKLCNTPAQSINEQIKTITEHNYNLMMEDWNGKFIQNLVAVVEPYLTADHKVVD